MTGIVHAGNLDAMPCQYGLHGSAESYGHSLIIDPWGKVLADAGEGAGVIVSEIDPAAAIGARAMIPALEHDREYAEPHTPALEVATG